MSRWGPLEVKYFSFKVVFLWYLLTILLWVKFLKLCHKLTYHTWSSQRRPGWLCHRRRSQLSPLRPLVWGEKWVGKKRFQIKLDGFLGFMFIIFHNVVSDLQFIFANTSCSFFDVFRSLKQSQASNDFFGDFNDFQVGWDRAVQVSEISIRTGLINYRNFFGVNFSLASDWICLAD